jgi:cell division protein FtsQ
MRIGRWARRLRALAIVAIVLLPVYWFWLRDSSLVAVNEVKVTGVSGAGAVEIRDALAATADGMTTLHVRRDDLARAVSRFPIVESIHVSVNFPHGLTIRVTQRRPVAVVSAPGQRIAVAGDGTLLRGVSAPGLPTLNVTRAPSGIRLTGDSLQGALILGATPGPLRPLLRSASIVAGDVRVELSNGPELRFGDGSEAGRKWAAAARLLADSRVGSGGYVDVSSPDRAAVGGSVQAISPSTTTSPPAAAATAAP